MDNLEQYIKDNREAFNNQTPQPNVWVSIEKRLSRNEDVFENYIQNNREAFDTQIPNLKLWATIEEKLPKKSSPTMFKITWWRQAAAAAALLIVGVLIGFYINEKQNSVEIAETTIQVEPEMTETEQFYNQKIETKLTQLVSYNPDPSVLADIKQLDEVQEELKKELKNAPNSTKEAIVKKMIENYQIKLGILERVLNHIEEHPSNNQKPQQQHESI